MRFLLAAMLFILSISLLLLGLAQRTIWAPPDSYSISLQVEAEKPYTLIPAEQLSLLPGDVQVSAVGPEQVYLAVGRAADVAAWVGESSHYQVETSADGDSLGIREIIGTEDYASPINSDLWQRDKSGEGVAQLVIPENSGLAVLVASDGRAPAPHTVRISWPIETSTVVSDIFMGVGFGILLLAIVLNLLALRRMLINRGPRRKLPKPPQGPKYRPKKTPLDIPKRGRRSARNSFIALPIALGLMLGATGCAPESTPTPTPSVSESPAIEELPPVVTESQVKRIIRDLVATVKEADATSDLNLLSERVAGPSFRFREARYLLMTKSDKVDPPEPLSVNVIKITLPAATNVWPRSVMVVTEDEGQLPQMLVLQQATPRENYKLWYNIPLLPGSEIPPVPAAEDGAIPVEADSLFLKISPDQLAPAFGDVIDNAFSSDFLPLFDLEGDEFYSQISASQQEQINKLKRATITFDHNLGDPNVIALSTSDSGALVALLMTDNYLIKPNKPNAAVTVSGDEKLLLGLEGSTKGVRTVYGDMLLFYVPASTAEEKIVLLGATQTLLSIKAL